MAPGNKYWKFQRDFGGNSSVKTQDILENYWGEVVKFIIIQRGKGFSFCSIFALLINWFDILMNTLEFFPRQSLPLAHLLLLGEFRWHWSAVSAPQFSFSWEAQTVKPGEMGFYQYLWESAMDDSLQPIRQSLSARNYVELALLPRLTKSSNMNGMKRGSTSLRP